MKTQIELLQELNKANLIARNLQINLDRAIEKVEYWEEIATQQNACIISQAKRYEKLEQTVKEIAQPIDTAVRITELETVLQAERTRNKEIDSMLATYEDTFRDLTKSKKILEKDITDITNAYKIQAKDLHIQKMNSNLFLKELAKYRKETREFQDMVKSTRPLKTKRLNNIGTTEVANCLDKIITQEQQDREIYQEQKGFRPINSIKVTFDKIGNYMPGRG